MKRKLSLKNKKFYIEIGDVVREFTINARVGHSNLPYKWQSKIKMTKAWSNKYYCSDKIELSIPGKPRLYSNIGDISYFPSEQRIGINICDEGITYGIPRYIIGNIKGDVYQFQTLLPVEEVVIYVVYELTLDKHTEI